MRSMASEAIGNAGPSQYSYNAKVYGVTGIAVYQGPQWRIGQGVGSTQQGVVASSQNCTCDLVRAWPPAHHSCGRIIKAGQYIRPVPDLHSRKNIDVWLH